MSRCATCGRVFYDAPGKAAHRCPPAWDVWPADGAPADATTVHADTAEEAATTWLSDCHQGAAVWDAETAAVRVRRVDGAGPAQAYVVRMELIPLYTARRAADGEVPR